MVDVILAGYNVDADSIKKVNEHIAEISDVVSRINNAPEGESKEALLAELLSAAESIIEISPEEFSPETVPASYARISRDPRPIPELRADARQDVEKARKSNANIIFDMGHKSVGNHSNFNFDILGLSRLAVEWLEARRIGCGYTEKSQRYITLEGDFVIPSEFSPEDAERFKDIVENVQNAFYKRNFETLVKFHYDKKGVEYVPDNSSKRNKSIDGLGKEDARYGLGLAIEAQIGTTFSGTALEHAVRNMKYSELAEVRELAKKLFGSVKDIAPSLILYTDPEVFQKSFNGKELHDDNFRDSPPYIRKIVGETREAFDGKLPAESAATFRSAGDDVKLIICNDVDINGMAAYLHANSGMTAEKCYSIATHLKNHSKKGVDFMRGMLKYVTAFDNPRREHEFSQGLKYEMVISSSCFAQLKRHRIMTLLWQDYDPQLGFTVPESIRETGLENELKEVCDRSAEVYYEFRKKYGPAAEYCLTNAHRRRVLVGTNPRELNHMARQRCDKHAQWDIRDKAHKMVDLAREVAPLTSLTTCGKDEFSCLHEEVYGCKE